MRVALISDLHANTVALDAVFADIDACRVDTILCLGDIVDMGPEPNEVVQRLRARAVRCIAGNHDPLDEVTPNPVLEAIRDWSAQVLSAENAQWLASLPPRLSLEIEGVRLLAVHGSPRSVVDNITADVSDAELRVWCAGHPFDVLVCGHTHVQLQRDLDGATLINCGSVGQPFSRPFDGSGPPTVLPRCDYAILDLRAGQLVSVEFRHIPLDLQAMRQTYPDDFPHRAVWLASWD